MASSVDGILNFLKPPGMTSHDGVAFLRRQLGFRRIGHAGTLDPGAAGVLPLCLGRATRLTELLQGLPKVYRAEMTLGISTDTHDQFGEIVSVQKDFALPVAALEEVCAQFIGTYQQVPPMTSARRHQGRRLYDLARQGQVVERQPRPVTLYRVDVVRIWSESPDRLTFGSRVHLDVECSSGTYVRTLLHDIGRKLGCGAHMSFLVRTRVGPFTIEKSFTCEELMELAAAGRMHEAVLPPAAGVLHLPPVTLEADGAHRFIRGQRLPWPEEAAGRQAGDREVRPGGLVRVHGPGEQLLGLAHVRTHKTGQRWIHPYRVLAPDTGSA